jgi:hypothetical protein
MALVQIVPMNLVTSECLISAVQKALTETAFSNRMMIAPRRLREIGVSEVAFFGQFVAKPDTEMARSHGCEMARNGFGHQSVLKLTSVLRNFGWTGEVSDQAEWFRTTEDYSMALLEGYMQGREDELKQEQERTRAAYIRTLQD